MIFEVFLIIFLFIVNFVLFSMKFSGYFGSFEATGPQGIQGSNIAPNGNEGAQGVQGKTGEPGFGSFNGYQTSYLNIPLTQSGQNYVFNVTKSVVNQIIIIPTSTSTGGILTTNIISYNDISPGQQFILSAYNFYSLETRPSLYLTFLPYQQNQYIVQGQTTPMSLLPVTYFFILATIQPSSDGILNYNFIYQTYYPGYLNQ